MHWCLCNNISHIPSGIPLRMVLLDHIADLCLVFKKPPYCFPKWLHYLTFPPIESSFFSASSPTFVVGSDLDDSYSNRSEVES
jgi:hypothetical protein